MATHSLMNTYARLDIAFSHGKGCWLYDEQNNAYLDALSGVGVCALGHAHPAVTAAITRQAQQVLHTSNIFRIPVQEKAADVLCKISGMDRVFFSNSGAEANEAAIKLARLHGHKQSISNPAIIVLENAFHGRTLATLTASGNRKIQAGFEPLVSGFVRAPFNDIAALETIARNNPKVVAVLVEPVQGEGGLYPLDEDYLEKLRALCDQHNWLLMLDEVQTGNGRTGRYFAFQHTNILPDVVTTAKGLGNGVPIGACLARGAAAELFQPGNHGSTFGGNPLACSAALVVMETINSENLCARAEQLGAQITTALKDGLKDCAQVKAIRGKGLMIGIELSKPCGELVSLAVKNSLLINVTAERVVRLLPPLIMSDDEARQLTDKLVQLISTF